LPPANKILLWNRTILKPIDCCLNLSISPAAKTAVLQDTNWDLNPSFTAYHQLLFVSFSRNKAHFLS
jgi:hypothetical protein